MKKIALKTRLRKFNTHKLMSWFKIGGIIKRKIKPENPSEKLKKYKEAGLLTKEEMERLGKETRLREDTLMK